MSINLSRTFSRVLTGLGTEQVLCSKRLRNRCKRVGRCRLNLELLEGRLTPTAPLVSAVLGGTAGTGVVGTVYADLDSNGVRNNGENGVAGWTVYLDLDQSGTLNTDAVGDPEPSAVTNGDGDFVINHLMPGTYRVSEVVQAGWSPTAPALQDLLVTQDQSSRVDFFNFSGGDIVGTVWNDLNEDGLHDAGEPGLSGWTVFLDFDNSRTVDPGEPSTLTDATGHYEFVNLPPNDYEVTVVLPDGWDISPGHDNRQTAGVVARTQFPQDFAFFSTLNGSIQGTVWNDLNGNGIRDTDATGAMTEPGLAEWTVFVDVHNFGVLDPDEATALTNSLGEYTFISLPAGDHEITEVLPAGWDVAPGYDVRQTVRVTAGEVTTGADFANHTVLNGSIRGTVWNDLNRNGIRDVNLAGEYTDPGLPGWQVYLDLNDNGALDPGEAAAVTDASGGYVFADLQVGDHTVREILPTGWETTFGYDDSSTVTVYSGMESIAPDFANFNLATATAGSVSGTVWNDLNGNGIRNVDPVSGSFTDPGLANWTVFVDLNGNGTLDTTDPSATTGVDGSYTIPGILPGTVRIVEQIKPGWLAKAPSTGVRTLALKNGENAGGQDFGNWTMQEAAIRGVVFADTDKNGTRGAGERGLEGITVYLDLNHSGALDAGDVQTTTSGDLYFTPTIDEAGSYSFTHLAADTYTVRFVVPAVLSATSAGELEHVVTVGTAEDRTGVDCAAVYRPTEIHGIKFDDSNGNHLRDDSEPGVGGVTVFVDQDRDDVFDDGEPTTVTLADGSYSFTGLAPGAYVIREIVPAGYEHTYPTTTGGILWPAGVSNHAVGNVTPTSITASLGVGEVLHQTVSITMPNSGALTNLVDVFLLFDDTGSFVYNSPIVRAAFPDIITQLQAALPGIDLGFGVGRFEEYGNFAAEYATGRPFILNQPIVAASTAGYMTAIQAALDRTTPGYGGDQPETDIEALYQLVTGLGFDGNNNGSVLDSGATGLASTQLNPGNSGDVPSFASFTADPANNVLPAAGTLGGGGFRAGALPIVLVATDTGFAYQPKGETAVTGVGGLTLPLSALTETSRPTTPFNYGAGIQETITGLNALGALVIGLGTNPGATLDPRQGLEALAKLTGAINHSTATIGNGTADPIAPGDPFYFQIASGFGGSVASGVISAIQNAVTNVAVDITVQASDPHVKIVNLTGVRNGIGSGQTATFNIDITGDGVPRRFDLQFVRAGTNVVLGSIPVVLGTPIPGDCYEFEDLTEGEIHSGADFGSHLASTSTTTPTIAVTGGTFNYDGAPHAATAEATGLGGVVVLGTVSFTYNGSPDLPTAAGFYNVVANFTSSDANYANATGTGTLTITAATPTITVTGGTTAFDGAPHAATAEATGLGGVVVLGTVSFTYNGSPDLPTAAGFYNVVANFTSSDANYANATGTGTLTITAATPTITVTGGTFTYDGSAHAASASAVGVDGVSTVAGSFDITYDGSAIPPTNAGTYVVVATFTSGDTNYEGVVASGSLTINPTTPAFSNLSAPTIPVGTAATILSGQLATGSAVPVGQSVSITLAGVTELAIVDGSGNFSASFATGALTAGTYPIEFAYAGDGANFLPAAPGSGTLTIQVVTNAPQVILQPLPQTVIAGTSVSFTAAAIGVPTPAVQWQYSRNGGKSFANIRGARSAILTFTAQASQNGYLFRAMFTNASGKAVTESATLTVLTPPTVTKNPRDRHVHAGSWVTFQATAAGNPAPTVRWEVSTDGGQNFAPISGAESNVLTFVASVDQNGNRYRAVFTSLAGTATTKSATLKVVSRA